MADVPIIELRKGVEVPKIPVVWDTNLSDKELAAVYQYLCKKSFFFSKLRPDESLTLGEDKVSIKSNMDDFEAIINGKTYRGWGTPKEVTVVYRPDSDWALMDKEAKAAEEREYERLWVHNLNREQEPFIIESIAKFIHVAEKHRDVGDLRNAEKMYRRAVDLKREHKIFYNPHFVATPEKHLLLFLADTKKVILGLEFLRTNPHNVGNWIDFGLRISGTSGARIATEVYREALINNPSSTTVYKRLAIHLESIGEFTAAIEVCRSAIGRELLSDGTKGGFKGRLARLEKKDGQPV